MTSKRAIIFIPGFQHKAMGTCTEKLASNIALQFPDKEVFVRIDENDDISLENTTFKKLDLYEAYWMDCIPINTNESPTSKILNGAKLIYFWLFSKIWIETRRSKSMTFGLALSGLALLIWYLTIIFSLFYPYDITDFSFPALLEQIKDNDIWNLATLTPIIAVLTLPLLASINQLIYISSSIRAYILNLSKDEDAILGTRGLIHSKICTVFRKVYAKDYDEVIIVAHSFGSIIAIEVLSLWQNNNDISKTTLVTWGSPINLIKWKSNATKRALSELIEQNNLLRWLDIYSHHDWLCSYVVEHKIAFCDEASVEITFDCELTDKMTGRTHLYYYTDMRVTNLLTEDMKTYGKRAVI